MGLTASAPLVDENGKKLTEEQIQILRKTVDIMREARNPIIAGALEVSERPYYDDFFFLKASLYTTQALLGLMIIRSLRKRTPLQAQTLTAIFHTKRAAPIQSFLGKKPVLPRNMFVAPNAYISGDVTFGANSSVWYNSVLRGDVNSIKVGQNVHLQDGTVVHVARNGMKGQPLPTNIGDNVLVSPNVILHACELQGNNVVGSNAQILDGGVMEPFSVLAPGSLLPPGKRIPSGQMWAGSPATLVRALSDDEKKSLSTIISQAASMAQVHLKETSKTPEQLLNEGVLREHDSICDHADYTPHVHAH